MIEGGEYAAAVDDRKVRVEVLLLIFIDEAMQSVSVVVVRVFVVDYDFIASLLYTSELDEVAVPVDCGCGGCVERKA